MSTRQSDYLPFLDACERRATSTVQQLYDLSFEGDDDFTERFWAQKGVEGMRLAVAEAFLSGEIQFGTKRMGEDGDE